MCVCVSRAKTIVQHRECVVYGFNIAMRGFHDSNKDGGYVRYGTIETTRLFARSLTSPYQRNGMETSQRASDIGGWCIDLLLKRKKMQL